MATPAFQIIKRGSEKEEVPFTKEFTIVLKEFEIRLSVNNTAQHSKRKQTPPPIKNFLLVEAKDNAAVKEFDRVAELSENIIRHLIVRVDEE